MTSHWDAIRRHWQLLGPPLRPPPDAVETYERELDLQSAHVLLLGVTPELADLGKTMLAVDESASMIASIWPGDTGTRKAVIGNWLDLPIASNSVDAVIGDGCLSALHSSTARLHLLAEIERVLKPGGRAGLRLFAGPEAPDDLAAVRELTLAGGVATFHELKWRIAMSCTGGYPDRAIKVKAILKAFDALFADREELSLATGWDMAVIGTIDVYATSQASYSFASAAVLVGEASRHFGRGRLAPTGTYDMVERCPLLVLEQPRR
ncbi:class I SAM-dependent methyltransferase [Mesorhizobium waimense]|uniref:Class I SAM-dependent methyltransferase n=1 Tax=Mesorhizobium waimense TaxID=1300307 RepID=A0A3A5KKM6_9HYPH|nr:methyltransferase domain-containing protein [Mesorhizobium waimense]RJT33315.1 class I SAM-dependent methyltransferase [Mesorhizobium waimense]